MTRDRKCHKRCYSNMFFIFSHCKLMQTFNGIKNWVLEISVTNSLLQDLQILYIFIVFDHMFLVLNFSYVVSLKFFFIICWIWFSHIIISCAWNNLILPPSHKISITFRRMCVHNISFISLLSWHLSYIFFTFTLLIILSLIFPIHILFLSFFSNSIMMISLILLINRVKVEKKCLWHITCF